MYSFVKNLRNLLLFTDPSLSAQNDRKPTKKI